MGIAFLNVFSTPKKHIFFSKKNFRWIIVFGKHSVVFIWIKHPEHEYEVKFYAILIHTPPVPQPLTEFSLYQKLSYFHNISVIFIWLEYPEHEYDVQFNATLNHTPQVPLPLTKFLLYQKLSYFHNISVVSI